MVAGWTRSGSPFAHTAPSRQLPRAGPRVAGLEPAARQSGQGGGQAGGWRWGEGECR